MKKNVLVVDDVKGLRQEIVFLLEDEDYTPFEAENGKRAIDVLNKETIDLIITDVMMPEMDGIELSIYCREHFSDIKIIIISGGGVTGTKNHNTQEDIFTKIENKGHSDAVLKKPFDYDELLDAIVKLID